MLGGSEPATASKRMKEKETIGKGMHSIVVTQIARAQGETVKTVGRTELVGGIVINLVGQLAFFLSLSLLLSTLAEK